MMTAAIQASGLGKAYRRTWALRDCTLAIPDGRVVGLVGPNGAGKTTLLRLATGMLTSTRGTISVLGEPPAVSPAQLARVGYVAQDTGHCHFPQPAKPGVSPMAGRRSVRTAHPRRQYLVQQGFPAASGTSTRRRHSDPPLGPSKRRRCPAGG